MSSILRFMHSDILKPHPYITERMVLCFILFVTSIICFTSSMDNTLGSVFAYLGRQKSTPDTETY